MTLPPNSWRRAGNFCHQYPFHLAQVLSLFQDKLLADMLELYLGSIQMQQLQVSMALALLTASSKLKQGPPCRRACSPVAMSTAAPAV